MFTVVMKQLKLAHNLMGYENVVLETAAEQKQCFYRTDCPEDMSVTKQESL
jgi:hypothetical protein